MPTTRRLTQMTGLTPLHATTVTSDPQAAYQGLRDRHGQVAPVELEPGIPAWLVMGYPECLQLTRNERLFSRDPNNWRMYTEGAVSQDSGLGPMMFPRDNAYFSDGERHRRLRAPLDDGIAGLDVQRMSELIRARCLRQLNQFVSLGRADLVAEYATVIPMQAITGLFGFPAEQGHELQQGLIALFGSGPDAQEGSRIVEELPAEVIRARRSRPADDLTTAFLNHPNLQTDSEIQQEMVLMTSAGWETTTTWIAQTLRLMLTDPRFAGRLRGGRLGVEDALNEVLWRDPPMANMPARYALADTTLAGQSIERGDALILGFAAANADPRVRPADLWLEVDNRSHLSWSAGPHACPAHRPAQMITRIAVDMALRHLHDVRLDISADEITLNPSPWTRCPAALPVTFAPSSKQTGASR